MRLFKLLSLLVLLCLTFASAQEVRRIVVLPFEAVGASQSYDAGLATALQRNLNVLDNVFVPPVGDTLIVTQRLADLSRLTEQEVATVYDATVIISGRVAAEGTNATVQLGFAGPAYPERDDVFVQGSLNDPLRLITDVTNAVVNELGFTISGDDRQQLNAMMAQTPSLPSLSAVAVASLRLSIPDLAAINAAATQDPSSSWVQSERARSLALTGNLTEALTVSQQANALNPLDVEAWVIRGIVLLSSGDTATARQAFDEALRINPAHALALQGKARTEGDLTQAQASLEAAIRAFPRLTPAYLDLAAIQRQTNPQQAIATLRNGALRAPDARELHSAIMAEAVRVGDVSGALAYLRDFVAAEPTASPAIYALAAEIPGTDLAPTALGIIQQGLSRYPDSLTLALSEAEILRVSDPVAAETRLQDLRANNPNNIAVVNAIALYYANQERFDDARQVLEGVSDTSGTLGVNLGQILLQSGQAEAAVSVFGDLVNRFPSDVEILTLYGIALDRAGRGDQALNAFERALAINPNDEQALRARDIFQQNQNLTGGQPVSLGGDAEGAYAAGRTALEQGDLDTAVREFARARSLDNNAMLAFYHAYALQLSGNPRAAIEGFERAIQEMPDNTTVLNNLGFAYYQIGRFDRALDYLSRAVSANPENVEAQLNLGLVAYTLDLFGQAVGPLQQAIALRPELGSTQVDAGAGQTLTLSQLLDEARRRSGQ